MAYFTQFDKSGGWATAAFLSRTSGVVIRAPALAMPPNSGVFAR